MSDLANEPASNGSGPDANGQAQGTGQGAGQGKGRGRRSSRSRRGHTPTASELWRPVPALPDPEPIVPAGDPTALLRSLGDPPLHGQATVAEHYLAAVAERAAGLATALAAAAGLLAGPATDTDDGA